MSVKKSVYSNNNEMHNRQKNCIHYEPEQIAFTSTKYLMLSCLRRLYHEVLQVSLGMLRFQRSNSYFPKQKNCSRSIHRKVSMNHSSKADFVSDCENQKFIFRIAICSISLRILSSERSERPSRLISKMDHQSIVVKVYN